MGMFDYYKPRERLHCPICAAAVDGWQGYDGPSALVRWIEGARFPVETVDEQNRDAEFMKRFELPDEFEIITFCSNDHEVVADCATNAAGVWTSTSVNAQKSNERNERRRMMRRIHTPDNPTNP